MKLTETFHFKQPDPDDFYDVQDFNDNMDIVEQELSDLKEKVGDGFEEIADTEIDDIWGT